MKIKNKDLVNKYQSFVRGITNKDKVAVLHHTDPDGISSAVIMNKLVKKLRLLGFDVDYGKDRDDHTLAEISEKENRVLLTRDRQLLKRKNITRGLFIRNTDPLKQVVEVIEQKINKGDVQ